MPERNPSNETMTSLSLLARVGAEPIEDKAWLTFVDRYEPKVRSWLGRWGLQEADIQDVSQEVMVQLARQMHKFEYDPSGRFRSWLKTIVWRAWVDYLKQRKRSPAAVGSQEAFEELQSMAAKEDLLDTLDREAAREQLEVAFENIKKKVKPQTFEAFRLMTFEELSGKQVAERLGMNVGAVFVARSRIDKMLSAEVKRLDTWNET